MKIEGDGLRIERAEQHTAGHEAQSDQNLQQDSHGQASSLTSGRSLAELRTTRQAGAPPCRFTRSRNSLPGLKCGTCLPSSATESPVLGLRPIRAGRKCSEK